MIGSGPVVVVTVFVVVASVVVVVSTYVNAADAPVALCRTADALTSDAVCDECATPGNTDALPNTSPGASPSSA